QQINVIKVQTYDFYQFPDSVIMRYRAVQQRLALWENIPKSD
ncbi:19804_t:CDS:1, partial [Gigaspora margarita]